MSLLDQIENARAVERNMRENFARYEDRATQAVITAVAEARREKVTWNAIAEAGGWSSPKAAFKWHKTIFGDSARHKKQKPEQITVGAWVRTNWHNDRERLGRVVGFITPEVVLVIAGNGRRLYANHWFVENVKVVADPAEWATHAIIEEAT